MQRKYRMIALDVDGTLIDDHFQILPKTREVLQRAFREGIMITLCTGRGPDSTIPLLEELGIEGAVIVHNGALCLHSVTSEIYGKVGLQLEQLRELVQFCRDRKIHFDVNTAFYLYVEGMNPEMKALYESYYVQPMIIDDVMEIKDEVVKFTIVAEEKEIDSLVHEIRDRFPQFRSTRSGENYIDVMHPLVSKGYGLTIVADKLNIPLSEVIAFGNYYNDIEMLERAGMGIAMENSPDEVKQCAKAVTRSNNEEGVYYGLMKYLYHFDEAIKVNE
jgi:Cof subfamily protein (haloacid dehalogenase superfamily)